MHIEAVQHCGLDTLVLFASVSAMPACPRVYVLHCTHFVELAQSTLRHNCC